MSSDAKPSVDEALTALAKVQHCVFSLDHACAVGITGSGVRGRAKASKLHRVYTSVYSLVPPELLTREGRFLAAVLACGPNAALSHRSAAVLQGLLPWGGANIDVVIPTTSHRKHAGIEIHRSRTLRPADVRMVKGIPCTTVARTLLDLAEVVRRRSLERAFDQAETMQVLDLRALNDQLERNGSRRGAKHVRAVLKEHYIGSTITLSEFEEAMIPRLRAAGLPMPEVNRWIVLPDGEPAIRADFCWPDKRVIVETDGFTTHRTRQAFERDRRRDQRLAAAGWRVIRITWRQLQREPRRVIATIAAMLNAAASPSS